MIYSTYLYLKCWEKNHTHKPCYTLISCLFQGWELEICQQSQQNLKSKVWNKCADAEICLSASSQPFSCCYLKSHGFVFLMFLYFCEILEWPVPSDWLERNLPDRPDVLISDSALTSLLMMMMMMLKICGKDSFRHPSASSHMTNHYFQNFSLN